MGEVYRTRDVMLGRDVAIKILPEALACDPGHVARFEREAKMLAALNHPNIAQIYGLEAADGVRALVMELIEGPTLADRLAQGPIPLDDALPIAKQIAVALEAAHEQGIIHRDLKPANIKLRPDGVLKLLDFGLAKAFDPISSTSTNATVSPTLSVHATQAGIILGTAAYMSPEQARGKEVDRRADIWAFGVVVFEMLTGRRAFAGDDISMTLAAVLTKDPDWASLPATTPLDLRRLLSRCLKKDPKERLQAIGDARIEVDELMAGGPVAQTGAASRRVPARLLATTGVAALAGGALIATLVTLAIVASMPAQPPQPMRFVIELPTAQPLLTTGSDRDLVISPDGKYVVYNSGDGASRGIAQLMVRATDQLQPVPLRGATGTRPFISPDSRWVGAFTSGSLLRKTPIAGGATVTVCRVSGTTKGATWGPDGTIVLATSTAGDGLFSVSDSGGEPKVLTTVDAGRGEHDHWFPSFLPGGRALLFTVTSGPSTPETRANTQVAVLDLQSGEHKMLIQDGSQAEYIDALPGSTDGGYLVYATDGALRAVRFDPVRLEVLSDPVTVLEQVLTKPSGAADFSLSRQGTLVFVTAREVAGTVRSLVWVDRKGREEAINAPARAYGVVRLSPDGALAALDIRDQQDDIWIWSFARQTLTPLTFEHSDNNPIWTADGRHIIFRSARSGGPNLFRQSADGTGTAERLTTTPISQTPKAATPDGKRLLFTAVGDETSANDLHVLFLDEKPRTEPLIQTAFLKNDPSISPDGRWLAYESNESGRPAVYVRPFPNVNEGRWQVSSGVARQAQWARDGRELFYLEGAGFLTSVRVETKPAFAAGKPTRVLDRLYYSSNGPWTYDISPDGQRFLMLKDAPPSDTNSAPASVVVAVNWIEELKSRIPPK